VFPFEKPERCVPEVNQYSTS